MKSVRPQSTPTGNQTHSAPHAAGCAVSRRTDARVRPVTKMAEAKCIVLGQTSDFGNLRIRGHGGQVGSRRQQRGTGVSPGRARDKLGRLQPPTRRSAHAEALRLWPEVAHRRGAQRRRIVGVLGSGNGALLPIEPSIHPMPPTEDEHPLDADREREAKGGGD